MYILYMYSDIYRIIFKRQNYLNRGENLKKKKKISNKMSIEANSSLQFMGQEILKLCFTLWTPNKW